MSNEQCSKIKCMQRKRGKDVYIYIYILGCVISNLLLCFIFQILPNFFVNILERIYTFIKSKNIKETSESKREKEKNVLFKKKKKYEKAFFI